MTTQAKKSSYILGDVKPGADVISGTWDGCPTKITIGPVASDFEDVPVTVVCSCGCRESGTLPAVTRTGGTVARHNALRRVAGRILARHHGI